MGGRGNSLFGRREKKNSFNNRPTYWKKWLSIWNNARILSHCYDGSLGYTREDMNILKEDVDKAWENNQFPRNFEFLSTSFAFFLLNRDTRYYHTLHERRSIIYFFSFNLNGKKFYHHVLILEIIYRLIVDAWSFIFFKPFFVSSTIKLFRYYLFDFYENCK